MVGPSVESPCPLWIAIAYPGPDTPTQQALGVAIAVLNKMVDDTSNQKERGNAENKTTFCFTRYT